MPTPDRRKDEDIAMRRLVVNWLGVLSLILVAIIAYGVDKGKGIDAAIYTMAGGSIATLGNMLNTALKSQQHPTGTAADPVSTDTTIVSDETKAAPPEAAKE